jgi:endonuclease YncB( thermonuclease family)
LPTIIQVRNRPIRKAPAKRQFRYSPYAAVGVVVAAAFALTQFPSITGQPLLKLPEIGDRGIVSEDVVTRHFTTCDRGRGDYCVIDGDTFTFRGQRIRIADIDAPETHPPRCEREARLGEQATRRLRELLSAGPFALRQTGPDEDRYGRKLRTVVRNERSLGAVLVSEGLAREWTGRRLPWCG